MINMSSGYGIDVTLASPSKEGWHSAVTSKILMIIASASTSLSPQRTHVLPNWKTGDQYLSDNYPVVTLRIGTKNMSELVYGRKISSTEFGHYVTYSFSAHVWALKTWQLFEDSDEEDETVPQANNASDLADLIIDVLEKYIGDSTSGICFFHKITVRESESERGPQRLTRMIIEGLVVVKRPMITP